MEEIWKEVVGYPSYEVSNLGNVRRYNYISGEYKIKKLKSLNRGDKNNKYGKYLSFNVSLGTKNKGKTLKVHQEVAKAFFGPKPAGMIVLHLDEDISNNKLDNLKYGTTSENVKMAFDARR